MNRRFAVLAKRYDVPVEAIECAAAHTFEMLDEQEQRDVIEVEHRRICARQATNEAAEAADGETKVIVATNRQQMRDDLIYQMQHHQYDIVYAYAYQIERNDLAEWIFATPRDGEDAVPPSRVTLLMSKLVVGLRLARQRFESVREAALRAQPRER